MSNGNLSRKERRALAKKNKVAFEPQYNGNGPVSYEEYYGKPRYGKEQVNEQPSSENN